MKHRAPPRIEFWYNIRIPEQGNYAYLTWNLPEEERWTSVQA